MSVKKFKFVSPGVFLNEIDNSQLPAEDVGIGPIIVGRTRQGPAMKPVVVRSPAEFVEVFGTPIPGGGGPDGDVWREGNLVGSTYASYAAMAYLNAGVGPITMVRLQGESHPEASSTPAAGPQLAGWKCDGTFDTVVSNNGGAYGLFLIESGASGLHSGHLAATLYCNDGALTLTGTLASAGTPSSGAAGAFETIGTYGEVKLQVHNTAGTVVHTTALNLNRKSDKFIREVLNTNPQLTNSDISVASNLKKGESHYWLGESFESYIEQNTAASTLEGSQMWAMLVALESSGSANIQRDDMKLDASPAETGWFFSQDLSTNTGSYDPANMQRLFKLVALSDGTWPQENLKISLQDIKYSSNLSNPYGSFTVLVRKASDRDNVVKVIERFSNVNLNPSSPDYIAKRIGTKWQEFDYDESRLRTYGEFRNQSKYFRVQMNEMVAQGTTEPSLLPFGTWGPLQLGSVLGPGTYTQGAPVIPADEFYAGAAQLPLAVTPNDGEFNLPTGCTMELSFPKLTCRLSASDGGLGDATDAFFGPVTTISADATRFDAGYGDYLRSMPQGVSRVDNNQTADIASWIADPHSKWASWQYIVTLDDVQTSGSATAFWKAGNRFLGTSCTAKGGSYKAILDAGYNRITTSLYGGLDGFNITEADPIRNSLLSSTAQLNTANYAFNTIKRAIDTVSDPEVVEANVITMPGVTNESLTQHLIDVCEDRADALSIIDLPSVYNPASEGTAFLSFKDRLGSVSEALAALRVRGLDSSYACTYYPWVQVRDTISSQLLWVPPSVVALGTFASSEARSQVWFAPAGFNRGGLTEGSAGLPVIGVSERVRSKDRDLLYEASVNPIATFPSEGIVIFGQKTLQVTPSALDRINVRRLMIYIKKQISKIANGILFDQNTRVTWSRLLGAANRLLSGIVTDGGLTEYKVILDDTTTTPDLVDRNIVYAKIFLKPARAIEYIAVDFNITRTGAAFDD